MFPGLARHRNKNARFGGVRKLQKSSTNWWWYSWSKSIIKITICRIKNACKRSDVYGIFLTIVGAVQRVQGNCERVLAVVGGIRTACWLDRTQFQDGRPLKNRIGEPSIPHAIHGNRRKQYQIHRHRSPAPRCTQPKIVHSCTRRTAFPQQTCDRWRIS